MSSNHSGNLLNQITFEEHVPAENAKRVVINSSATIFAVVNTGSAGNVTLDPGSRTGIVGNLTLSDSKGFIGLVTADTELPAAAAQQDNLSDPNTTGINVYPAYRDGSDGNWDRARALSATLNTAAAGSGIAPFGATAQFDDAAPTTITEDRWGNLRISTNRNLYATIRDAAGNERGLNIDANGNLGAAIIGNVTLSDSKGFIGLVTVVQASSARTITGNVTLDVGSLVGIRGNLTLSDAKGFIGLVTIGGGLSNVAVVGNVTLSGTANVAVLGNLTLSDSKGFIGLVTVNPHGLIGNLTLTDSKGFIGLVTVGGIGTVTLADPKGFIGLVTIGGGLSNVAVVGNVTISNTVNVAPIGNVTLSDSKGFIGLVTAFNAYGSNSTVYTGVISATGNTTVLVAPASNRFFIKNAHITSLGRSEVEVRSGATTIIPFTSLSTTSGFTAHYGEMGLPARAQTDALVVNLNGGATIGYMFNVYFQS